MTYAELDAALAAFEAERNLVAWGERRVFLYHALAAAYKALREENEGLQKDNTNLRNLYHEAMTRDALDAALNEGDGSYKP